MKTLTHVVCALIFTIGCASSSSSGPAADTTDVTADVAPGTDTAGTADAPTTDAAVADISPSLDVAPDVAAEVSPDVTTDDSVSVPDTPEIDVVVSPDVGETDTAQSSQPTEHPPIEAQFETWIGDWTMQPGAETTKCVVKKLDNPEPIWVTGIHTSLQAGSHHMIVYKTGDTDEQPEPFGCTPFTETLTGKAYPLIITQIAEESLVMPPGVAVKFEPYQTIRMEAHFLNYFPEEITAHGEVTFDTIAAEDVWNEADMLFYGDIDFELPPNSTYQTDWSFLSVGQGAEVFAVTGHTHKMGTNMEVYYADDVNDDSTPVYPADIPFAWDEAPVTQYDPPLQFNGSNGFRFRCSWDNTTDSKVGFGESANQEMCFMWAYYYPADGYQVCVDLGSVGSAYGLDNICCPGSFVCDLIPGFL